MFLSISNPVCVGMLRGDATPHTEVVERALCKRMGIMPRAYRAKAQGRPKTDSATRVPVKITDARIIEYLENQKRTTGAPYRHTAEAALLDAVPKRKRKLVE